MTAPSTPARPPRSRRRLLLAAGIPLVLGGVFMAFAILYATYRMPSGSMMPTLSVGDTVIVSRFAYARHPPARGDLIVFRSPRDPRKDFIKRVVAVAGDTIAVAENGQLVLNGALVPRVEQPGDCRYVDEIDGNRQERECRAFVETIDGRSWTIYRDPQIEPHATEQVTVPPGEVFTVGDNRDNSFDSRHYGPVTLGAIKGRLAGVLLHHTPAPVAASGHRIER